jgi:hypothetical protein
VTVTLVPRKCTPARGQTLPTVEPLEFRTTGALLRHLVEHGRTRTDHRRYGPHNFPLGLRDRGTGKPSGYAVYEASFWLRDHDPDAEQLHALMRLQDRYAAYRHYLTEVMPEWHVTDRIPYADNSVVHVETNRWGGTRRVEVEAPHGDACF